MFGTNGTPKKTTKKDKPPLDTTERARESGVLVSKRLGFWGETVAQVRTAFNVTVT